MKTQPRATQTTCTCTIVCHCNVLYGDCAYLSVYMYAAHVHVHVWMLRFVFPCDLVYSLPTVTFQECQIFLHAHCNNAGTMIHVLRILTCIYMYMYIHVHHVYT